MIVDVCSKSKRETGVRETSTGLRAVPTRCDDFFGMKDAKVACKQLGYTGAEAYLTDVGVAPGRRFWLDDVNCVGSEAKLTDCFYNSNVRNSSSSRTSPQWGIANCVPAEQVGVACTSPTTANSILFNESHLTVQEQGGGSTYTVHLGRAPSGNVTVAIAGQSATVTVDSTPLAFTTGNWGTAQTVTLEAPHDNDTSDETRYVTHRATKGGYTTTSSSVQVEIEDDDDGESQVGPRPSNAAVTVAVPAGRACDVSVPVLDDAHDEGGETLTLTLSNPSGAHVVDGSATGTINNSDPMPGAWMVRFGRTVGSHVVDALGQRLEGGAASHVTVGGFRLTEAPGAVPEAEPDDPFGLPGWAKRTQPEESPQSLSANDVLLGSAFHLSSQRGQGAGAAYTAWGRIATSGFEAEADDVTMDADVTTGLIGFDAEWERVLAGVMLSQSTGEGDYRLSVEKGGKAGSVDSSLTGVYPYARLVLNARMSAWALAGAGNGELTLKQEGDEPMPTGITMRIRVVRGGQDIRSDFPVTLRARASVMAESTAPTRRRTSDRASLLVIETEESRSTWP